MSIRTTHWVFWISLLLLIPLPVYGQSWGWLPVAYLILTAFYHFDVLYLLQALFWGALLWWLSRSYCRWTAHWEAKLRGSVMAIAVLSLLILFASIPVYRPVDRAGDSRLTFQWLYE